MVTTVETDEETTRK